MNRCFSFPALACLAWAQPATLCVGSIDFYGYAGLDPAAVRARLPVHEGDQVSEDGMEKLVERIKQDADATSVNAVCCQKGALTLYIGLRGRSVRDVAYHPAPHGPERLPQAVLELDRQFSAALTQAIGAGHSAEDQSKGYALSVDPAVRAKQLAMRDYAAGHQRQIQRVLHTASDAGQRAIAARLMGYARQSRAQVDALVEASRDPDDETRNNATRALWVLATSSPKRAALIPAAGFIEMLYSRSWTDRNKASLLLEALTRTRDPKLLAALRAQALDPLREMAGWRDPGHAFAARMMLGRCEGIPESRLEEQARHQP